MDLALSVWDVDSCVALESGWVGAWARLKLMNVILKVTAISLPDNRNESGLVSWLAIEGRLNERGFNERGFNGWLCDGPTCAGPIPKERFFTEPSVVERIFSNCFFFNRFSVDRSCFVQISVV